MPEDNPVNTETTPAPPAEKTPANAPDDGVPRDPSIFTKKADEGDGKVKTEAPPVETKPKTEEPPKDAPPAKATSPAEVKLALGKETSLTKEHLAHIQAYAKEQGLNQEQSEKILGYQESQMKAFYKAMDDKVKAEYEDLKNDKELGGKNFEGTQKKQELALSEIFNEQETKDWLNWAKDSGSGNVKILNLFVKRVGEALDSGDAFFNSSGTGKFHPQTREGRAALFAKKN